MTDRRDFENEEEDSLIELTDEEGVTTTYEILAQFPFKGENFVAVAEPFEEEPAEDVEVLLLQVDEDEDGNEVLVVPEDALYEEAFDRFMEIVESDEGIEFSEEDSGDE